MKNETIQKDLKNGNYLDINNYFDDVQINHNKEGLEYTITIRDKILLNLDFKNIHLMTYQSIVLIYLIFKNKQNSLFKLDSGFYINLENYYFEISEDCLRINLKLRDEDILIKKDKLTNTLFRLNFGFFCQRTLRKVRLKILYESSKIFHNNNLKIKFINLYKNFYLFRLKEKYKVANFNRLKKKIVYSAFYNKIIMNKAFFWKKLFLLSLHKKYWKNMFFTRIKFLKEKRIKEKTIFIKKQREFVTNIINIKYFNTISYLKRIIYFKNIKKHKDDMSRKVASYLLKSRYFKKLKLNFTKRLEVYRSIDHLYRSKCALKLFIYLKSQVSLTNTFKLIQKGYNYNNYFFLNMCLESYLQTNMIIDSLKTRLIKRNCRKHINTVLDLFYYPKLKSIFYNLKYYTQRRSIVKINFGMMVKNYFSNIKEKKQKKIRSMQISINNHNRFIKYFIRKNYLLKMKTSSLKEKQIKQSKSLGDLVFKRNVFITFVNNCRGFVFDKLNKVISQNIFHTNRLRFCYNLFMYNIYNKPCSLLSPKNKGLTKRKSYYFGFKRRLCLRIGFIRLMLRTNERTEERRNIREYKMNHIIKTKQFFVYVKMMISEKKFTIFRKKNLFYSFLKKVNNNKTKKLYYKTIDDNLDYKRKLKAFNQLEKNMIKKQNKRNIDLANNQKLNLTLLKYYWGKTYKIIHIKEKLRHCANSLIVLRKLFYFSKIKRVVTGKGVKEIAQKFLKKNFFSYISFFKNTKENLMKLVELFSIKLRKIYFLKFKSNKDDFYKISIKKNYIIRIKSNNMLKNIFLKELKEYVKLNKLKIFYFKRLLLLNIFRKGSIQDKITEKQKKFKINFTLSKLLSIRNKRMIIKSKLVKLEEISRKFYMKNSIKFLSIFIKTAILVNSIEKFRINKISKLFLFFIKEVKSFLNLSSFIVRFKKKAFQILKEILIKKNVESLFSKIIDFYKKKLYLYHILKQFLKNRQTSIKEKKLDYLCLKHFYKSFCEKFSQLKKKKHSNLNKQKIYFNKLLMKRLKGSVLSQVLKKTNLQIEKQTNKFIGRFYMKLIKKNIKLVKIKRINRTKKQEEMKKLLFNIIKDNYLGSKYLKYIEINSNKDIFIDTKGDIINNFENFFS